MAESSRQRSRATAWSARVFAVCFAGTLLVVPGAGGATSAATTQPLWNLADPGLPRGDPPGRYGQAAAFDPQLGGVVMVGGTSGTAQNYCFGPYPYGCYVEDGVKLVQCTVIGNPGGYSCVAYFPDPFDCPSILGPTNGSGDAAAITWLWRNDRWTQLGAGTLPPLDEAAAVYDPLHGQVVLLGLSHGLLQTWTSSGATWVQRHPAVTPPPRYGFAHAMAFDGSSQTVLLFGGRTGVGSGASGLLGDTWSWDGTTWAHLSPASSPSPREGAAMAYDPKLGRIVLVGGVVGATGATTFGPNDSSQCVDSAETWTWDGTTWSRSSATGPPARADGALAYDADLHALVLFGGMTTCGDDGPDGQHDCSSLSDTWVFDGAWRSPWTGAAAAVEPLLGGATEPAGRWSTALVTDPLVHGLLLFGGQGSVYSTLGDTWKLSSITAP